MEELQAYNKQKDILYLLECKTRFFLKFGA
jgi:hypothetical protein